MVDEKYVLNDEKADKNGLKIWKMCDKLPGDVSIIIRILVILWMTIHLNDRKKNWRKKARQ